MPKSAGSNVLNTDERSALSLKKKKKNLLTKTMKQECNRQCFAAQHLLFNITCF